MGRHKFPVITNEDGSIFYDKDYEYKYGRCDVIRGGKDLTVAATGAMVGEALKAIENIKKDKPDASIELIACSSIKHFDKTISESVDKTEKLITVEDHNIHNGLGTSLAAYLTEKGIEVDDFKMLGVRQYQLSGKSLELYEEAGISAEHIQKECLNLL
jgi:transketolase